METENTALPCRELYVESGGHFKLPPFGAFIVRETLSPKPLNPEQLNPKPPITGCDRPQRILNATNQDPTPCPSTSLKSLYL